MSELFEESCTPMLNKQCFIRRKDFMTICGDGANADALRVIEMMTNQRIEWLRERYGIDKDYLPNADDLWLTVSLRDVERTALHTYSKSTFERCFCPQTSGGNPSSLIELGFIEQRIIARPAGFKATVRPWADLYEDEQGQFLLVNERHECHLRSGEWKSAAEIGYTRIERQHRYCIEKVNEALAMLDEEALPKPMPRWNPVATRNCESESITGEKLS
jgi:hypothetical protein